MFLNAFYSPFKSICFVKMSDEKNWKNAKKDLKKVVNKKVAAFLFDVFRGEVPQLFISFLQYSRLFKLGENDALFLLTRFICLNFFWYFGFFIIQGSLGRC